VHTLDAPMAARTGGKTFDVSEHTCRGHFRPFAFRRSYPI
jgi:hypothetical protein